MGPLRLIACTLAVAASVAIASGGPALAHEAAPTAVDPAAALAEAPPQRSLPPVLVATAAGLVLLTGALAAGTARCGHRPTGAQLAAAALALSGVAHGALTPSHWGEAWHIGVFFAGSAILLLGEAITLWRHPSTRVFATVFVTTLVLIGAYFVSRQAALPLIGHRDPYRLGDLPVKAAEFVAGGLALAALLPRLRTAYGDSPWTAARSWDSPRACATPPPTRP